MTTTRTSEFFDTYAADFDALYGTRKTLFHRLVNRYLRPSMRVRFEKTMAGCDPIEGKSVIDIGCGPGHYAVALARKGASSVLGLDFADGMIELARHRAGQAGVADRCEFVMGDFLDYPITDRFDYCVVMGFMDYVADARKVIDRTLSIAKDKAFFSFPAAGGVLAWQRKLRYRRRCDLYLYSSGQLAALFAETAARDVEIEKIGRCYFVTATVKERGHAEERSTAETRRRGEESLVED